MNMKTLHRGLGIAAAVLISSLAIQGARAQDPAPASETLFRNVRVLDVVKGQLGAPTNVLIEGDHIAKIGGNITARWPAKVIEGGGRTLMPGMIDVHVHLTFSALTMPQMLSPDLTPEKAEEAAGRQSHDMLLRGFTAVRDAGGPIFGLKRRIDSGELIGPR
ncbi:MAG: amidohydrolase family protein, partial [Sphingopyxis sp.]